MTKVAKKAGKAEIVKEDLVECQGCGHEIPRDECIEEGGAFFCEDCYFDSHQRIKACDPWAVRSKKLFREQAGQEGTEGLTEVQQAIYELVRSSGGATLANISKVLDLSAREVENQFAILRHCELLKAQKRDDGIYVVPFERDPL